MKILLTNCWQAGNTGDVAIWINLMRRIKEAFPLGIDFLIASQQLLEWDCKQLEPFNPTYYENNIEQAVKDADIVISQGGGYMIGDGMMEHLKAYDLAQSMGKPVFISTQTMVGPINEETTALLNKVMNAAIVVSPRDQGTYNLLKDAGVEKDLTILPDTVFDIGVSEYATPNVDSIKFAIRGYDYDGRFVSELAKLADMVTASMGDVLFIPVGNGGGRDDRVLAREVISKMTHTGYMIEEELTAEDIKSILRDGMLFSDRYHGIIYSISMNTPFVAMTPDIDSKMPGLLSLINYPIPILDKGTFTAESAFPHLFNVWSKRNRYREIFETVTPKIKEDAATIYPIIIQGIKDAITK